MYVLSTLKLIFVQAVLNTVVYQMLIVYTNVLVNSSPHVKESGKFFHLESGILESFACGIRNPGPWNPEYRCRNPESH